VLISNLCPTSALGQSPVPICSNMTHACNSSLLLIKAALLAQLRWHGHALGEAG
jgi:hypothetical protein